MNPKYFYNGNNCLFLRLVLPIYSRNICFLKLTVGLSNSRATAAVKAQWPRGFSNTQHVGVAPTAAAASAPVLLYVQLVPRWIGARFVGEGQNADVFQRLATESHCTGQICMTSGRNRTRGAFQKESVNTAIYPLFWRTHMELSLESCHRNVI